MSYIQNCVNSVHSKFNNLCYREAKSVEHDIQDAIKNGKTARIVQLAKQNPSFDFNKALPNGELPLNYAMRTTQPVNVARVLTRNGADPLHFDDQGLNAFATAYYKGDHERLNALILPVIKTMHADLQKQFAQELIRNKGVNPFHYVAAIYGKEKLNSNITPAELNVVFLENLAEKLNEKSPFAISKYDAAMFATTLAWGIVNYLPKDMVHPQVMQLMQIATFSPLAYSESSLLYTGIGLALSNASLFSEKLAPLSYCINTLLAIKLAHNTFHGMKSCWRNLSLNHTEALKKAVVVYAPKIATVSNQLRTLPEKINGLWDKVSAMMEECGTYSGDNKTECELRCRIKHETCANPELVDECKNAEEAFANGVENEFTPNYKDWDLADLTKHDCSQYENDNLLDCQNKHKRIVECMAQDADPVRCTQLKANVIDSIVIHKFAPQPGSQFWLRFNAFRNFNTSLDCPENFEEHSNCVENYNNWQAKCNKDFDSQDCLDAENTLKASAKKIPFIDFSWPK